MKKMIDVWAQIDSYGDIEWEGKISLDNWEKIRKMNHKELWFFMKEMIESKEGKYYEINPVKISYYNPETKEQFTCAYTLQPQFVFEDYEIDGEFVERNENN